MIGPRLIKGDKPIAGAQFRRPFHQGSTIPTRIDYAFAQNFSPSSKPRYRGKVVMLINEQAISQAEHTCLIFSCLIFSAATDVTFIGTPTNGTDGDITDFVLPGGLSVVFMGHDVRHGDGRQLQRVGVQPHITVAPTIGGIREGRDEVMEAEVKYLQTQR